MFPSLGAGDDMFRMHAAWRQDCDCVDILSCQEIIDVVMRGNAELRSDGIGPCRNRIANGGENSPADMATTQQFRMALCNATAAEQADSDHYNFPLAVVAAGEISRKVERRRNK